MKKEEAREILIAFLRDVNSDDDGFEYSIEQITEATLLAIDVLQTVNKEEIAMTQEEKAKAYDEAFSKAKSWHKDSQLDFKKSLENLFPGLKESNENKDEDIRKALINVFATHKDYEMFFGVSVKDILAWLEKQGQVKESLISQHEKCKESSDSLTSEDERIKKEIIDLLRHAANCMTGDKFNERIAWLEKQGQSKKISIWKHWKDGVAGNGDGIPVFLIKDGSTYSLSSVLGFECDYIELSELDNLMLEKQDEQKLTDKVEPKFKVGDWITNGQLTCKVLSVTSKSYEQHLYNDDYFHFETEIQKVDKDYHLWNIKDAKDGDVLAAQECYVIFKEIDGLNIKCYCTYHYMGFNPSFSVNTLQNKTAFHPATKEQRDALKKAITKAGYRWDEDKKEFNQTPIS